MKCAFIGCGNMANAIIGGIIRAGLIEADDIIGAEPTKEGRERTKNTHGIHVTDSNAYAASEAQIVFLCVKPQYIAEVIEEIRDSVDGSQLVISIVAGKTTADLAEMFGDGARYKIIRLMPNTPALIGAGMTAVCANENVADGDLKDALKLVSSFGLAEVVPEALFDTVTAVSGSSPAYVFMFIEAMADAAVKGGMPRQTAYRFAAQAVFGSAKLMLETGQHPAVLKDMVCSPGGTTIEAVQALEEYGLRAAVMNAMEVCAEKSAEM